MGRYFGFRESVVFVAGKEDGMADTGPIEVFRIRVRAATEMIVDVEDISAPIRRGQRGSGRRGGSRHGCFEKPTSIHHATV
jgi:hypothetical protein